MNTTPLISVLMPAYNSEKYIQKAIHSILDQTYQNIELLICDDCSTDNTYQVVQSIQSPKIRLIQNEKNQGYLKTCNRLFTEAKGEFITFQDSDDYSTHERLQTLLDEFNKDPELSVCGSQFNFVSDDGEVLANEAPKYPETHEEIVNQFKVSDEPPFCGASVMIKKEVYEKYGGYHEYWDRIGAEDHYWLYVILEKEKGKNVNNTFYFYRHNPNSVTRNKTNPRKMHCHDFLKYFFNQRKTTGTDDIEQNNQAAIQAMEQSFIAPYEKDPTLLYQRLADWAYTAGKNKEVFHRVYQGIKERPFHPYMYKTLWHYFKKIYLSKA